MADASIKDIGGDGVKQRLDPIQRLLGVQEKFHMDYDDAQAIELFQSLMQESVSALLPKLYDKIHRWAQYWRS